MPELLAGQVRSWGRVRRQIDVSHIHVSLSLSSSLLLSLNINKVFFKIEKEKAGTQTDCIPLS